MFFSSWLKNVGQALREVYSSKGYWFVSLGFIIFLLLLHAFIMNHTLLLSGFSILLWLELVYGLFFSLSTASLIFLFLVAFFGAMVLSLSVYVVRRQIKTNVSAGGIGVLAGILAPACPSCALGLFGVVGIGGFLTVLPFKGLELGVLGILILLGSLIYLSNKVMTTTCAVNKKKRWTVANILTLLRVLLAVPLVVFILQDRIGLAIVIFCLGLFTDFDGAVARKLQQTTSFGEKFDLIADFIFGGSAFIALLILGNLEFLFVSFVVLANIPRIVFLYLFQKQQKHFRSTLLTKLSGLFTFLAIPLALLFPLAANWFLLAVALFTLGVTFPHIEAYRKLIKN